MDYDMINILIEVAGFGLLGLLYYTWQKKRIIRADVSDIFHQLDKLTFDLNHYLEDHKNKSFYYEINKTVEAIEKERELPKLKELLLRIPADFPLEILKQKEELLEQIDFHCQSNS
jgi:hypothetical protein